MLCKQCGAENAENRRFCSSCGAPLTESAQNIEQAAQQAAQTPVSAEPIGATLGKVLDSAKNAAGSVQSAAKKVDLSKVNVKAASGTIKNLLHSAGALWKKLYAQRAFRTAVTALVAVVVISIAAAGAYSVVGRDLTQTVLGEEKYAHAVITNALEKSLFAAMDYIKTAPVGEKAENIRATASIGASIPDSYLDDIIYELYPGYMRPSFDQLEFLRLLCNSSIEAGFMMNTSSRNALFSLSGGWKVDGKSMLDAELKASGSKLYISAPQLLGETLGVDLNSLGFDLGELASIGNLYSMLMSDILYSGYYGYGYSYGTEIEELLTTMGDYVPKLKPILSKAIESAVGELEMSLINNEVVDINDKTAKLDVVNVLLTEESTLRAAIAMLESIRDNDKAIALLADMTRDLSMLDVNRMSEKDIEDALDDLIWELEDELAFALRYPDPDVIEFSLYINAGNGICGISFMSDFGDSFGFVAKPGTGYELYYGDELRVYGDLGGVVGYSGDVNVYFREGRNVIEGKVCDFTFSGGLSNFSASVTVEFAEIFDLISSASGSSTYLPEVFEDLRMTYKVSADSNSSTISVALSSPANKATLTSKMSVNTGKKANISVDDKVKVYTIYELPNRIDTDDLTDNLDKLVEKLDKMGYDISGLIDDMYY